ncbi:DNA-J related domain-containing protein [Marinicellulosiphila megalodicopiae]|uniref:DNA-J related domain-containing protein n=1 Tax=Marinicellulosiphila megalodicopiae TaxID=2724896 RepID=UPI003BB164A4
MINKKLGLFSHSEIEKLHNYLKSNTQSNEFEIIKSLFFTIERPQPDFFQPLDLFHTHFILFNGLHRLNCQADGKFYIEIKSTQIQYIECSENKHNNNNEITTNTKDQSLCDYYLDEKNFAQASKQKIEQMLSEFSIKFQNYLDAQTTTHDFFDLNIQQNWKEIKKHYQHLVQVHHPDKSGDTTTFLEIQKEFEQLKKYYPND